LDDKANTIHKEKGLSNPGGRRGSHLRSIRMSTRKAMRFGTGSMEGNMALIGFAQLDTNNKYIFLTHVHKETWVGLAVKLWGSISCAGVTSSVKHTRVNKNTSSSMIFFEVSLAKLKVVWSGGLFMRRADNIFL
jgi:hypothetical protein